MAARDEDRFRIRPGRQRQRGDAFVSKVLRQANRAGAGLGKAMSSSGGRPGSRLGRGHVAARFAGHGLGPGARRVAVKVRLVNLSRAGGRSLAMHLRYIEREGVDRQGGPGRAYSGSDEAADLQEFAGRSADDRHQFRLIVSAEDAIELEDLRTFTRHLMARMETDLGTRLEWVAVDHWNTDNPHTHVVLRGKDQRGKDLVISQDYISSGMRQRGAELATSWLGPRTELEISRGIARQVEQQRWTGLDRSLQQITSEDGNVSRQELDAILAKGHRQALLGRLQVMQRMGMAQPQANGGWWVEPRAEVLLRSMGERGDIIRSMQRAMGGAKRELAVLQALEQGQRLSGRVVATGMANDHHDQPYLVIDATDGKAHYLTLPPSADLQALAPGAIVELASTNAGRAADRAIASLVTQGTYRTAEHLANMAARGPLDLDAQEVVRAHVRRLESLRRAGIVERVKEGVWRVPPQLVELGQRHDMQQGRGSVQVTVKSHLGIDQQVRAVGATWLDQQLLNAGKGLVDLGFGAQVRSALTQRVEFLVEQGLASQHGGRTTLTSNLLAKLRNRDVERAAAAIAERSGRRFQSVSDGQRVTGTYARSVALASGRYALIEQGEHFSLLPWRPVIDKRLGQHVTAVVHGSSASWEVSRQRDRGITM